MKSTSFEKAISDRSEATKALKAVSTTAKKWTNVDVDSTANTRGFSRGHAVSKLQKRYNCGAVDVQPSGVTNQSHIMKEFPKNEMAKDYIMSHLYERSRSESVIDLITARSCLGEASRDKDFVPKAGRGYCFFCETKPPAQCSQDEANRPGRIDLDSFQAILASTPIQDDLQFLARVYFAPEYGAEVRKASGI
ncbi:MAG: hypothetical protein Q9201_002337 [Fulgogasparrea decipioides]